MHLRTNNISKLRATSEYWTIVALGSAAFSFLWRFILIVVLLTHFIETGKSISRAALNVPQPGLLSGSLPTYGKDRTLHSSPDPDPALCTEKLSACLVWDWM